MAENKFRYSHDNCPVCQNPFLADDDIVVCPACGTPHHRECYKQNGSCSNADKHDEGFHWESSAPVEEPQKQADYIHIEMNSNPENSESNQQPFPPSFGFPFQNPLNAFPPEFEEGVSTEDVASFVQQDSIKYIQKFFYIKGGRKQWNWAAIFFAPYWFFYRKLYKHGAIVMALMLCLSFLLYLPPVEKLADSMAEYQQEIAMLSQTELTNEEYLKTASELTMKAQQAILENKLGAIILVAQNFLSLVLVIYVGSNANKWYYNHVVKSIKNIRAKENNPDTVKQLIFKTGGVSYGPAFLSVLAEKTIILGFELILMMFNH